DLPLALRGAGGRPIAAGVLAASYCRVGRRRRGRLSLHGAGRSPCVVLAAPDRVGARRVAVIAISGVDAGPDAGAAARAGRYRLRCQLLVGGLVGLPFALAGGGAG